MDQTSLSFTSELLKAVPSIATAAAAIYGVVIAKAGLDKWRRETIGKRKAELAEEVIADFYQARDIIDAARSPATFAGEGETRKREAWETDSDTQTLNAYFATTERLNKRGEFFAQLYARRYRFMALFGLETAKPYDELWKIHREIIIAVRMLVMTYRQREQGSAPRDRKTWETIMGWGMPEDDTIPGRLDQITEAIEKTCRPAIQEIATR